jgi:membrane protease YdiL (CAAX protease family)
VLAYHVLTFAISWVCILLVAGGPGGIPATREAYERLLPLGIPALLVGPTVASLLLTGPDDGRAGHRDLLARLLRWRVGARWYAVALLTAPLALTATVVAFSLLSPEFLPSFVTTGDRASLLLFGLFEELGWTRFAIPRLRLRYGVLATALLVGVLWGAWHSLQISWVGRTSSAEVPLALYLPLYFFSAVASLTAYRVLMGWLYDRTGSLLLAVLMHASLISCSSLRMAITLSNHEATNDAKSSRGA